jgi:hypothetical protein
METIIIIAAIVIAFSIINYRIGQIKTAYEINSYTLNLLQDKTRESDNYKRRYVGSESERRRLLGVVKDLEVKQAVEIKRGCELLRAAEAKNEGEYKRGWDDCLDEQKSGKLEIEGGILEEVAEEIIEPGTQEC